MNEPAADEKFIAEGGMPRPPKRKSKRAEQFKEIVRDIAEMAAPAAELAGEGENDERETPPDVYQPLYEEFKFTLDVASSHDNHKTDRYCTSAGTFLHGVRLTSEHGLVAQWGSERVWCNPPFSDVAPWIERAWDEIHAEAVVVLLPNNRTEQPFWQRFVEPYRDRPGSVLTTRHLAKRRAFGRRVDGQLVVGKSPPFGLVLLVWSRISPVHGPKTRR